MYRHLSVVQAVFNVVMLQFTLPNSGGAIGVTPMGNINPQRRRIVTVGRNPEPGGRRRKHRWSSKVSVRVDRFHRHEFLGHYR